MKTIVLGSLVAVLLVLFCSLGEAIKDASLVLYLPLDEGEGNITKDLSGKGNDGVLEDNATWTQDGKVGKAISFDGEESHVDCGNDEIFDITDEITLEAWVKPNEEPAREWIGIVCKHGCYKLRQDTSGNGKFYGFVYTGGVWDPFCISTTEPEVGKWYHAAFTYDGEEEKIYINGVLENTVPRTGKIDVTGESNLAIGADRGGLTRVFNGTVDEVAVYNRALSEAEINKDMKDGVMAVSLKGKLATAWARIKAY